MRAPMISDRPEPAGGAEPAGPAPAAAPVKVLYIAGSGRSGSTLLERILGQLDGFFSAGELRYVWERGMLHNRLCGCGLPFADCAVWTSVVDAAFGRPASVDPRAMIAQQDRRVRTRHLPGLLLGRRRPRGGGYETAVERLYHSIREVTGARVVVDSSKLPPYGSVLGTIPGIDLYVVHLVRDPRATAYSWLRKRELRDFGDSRLMQRQRPWKSAVLWGMWNTVAEVLWRPSSGHYLRLRYEDFTRDPQATVGKVLDMLGEHPAGLPFRSPTTVALRPTHSVAGNPGRFASGTVELHPDAEWTREMRARDEAVVTAVTWPLLLRYGYPVRHGPKPAP